MSDKVTQDDFDQFLDRAIGEPVKPINNNDEVGDIPQDRQDVSEYDRLENFDDWADFFVELHANEQAELWGWADACLQYRLRMGKSFKDLSAVIPRTKKTLESYCVTAETFPADKRYPDVGFSVYRICAYSEQPYYWLQKALEHGWTNAELRQQIAEEEGTFTGPCVHKTFYCTLQNKMTSPQECNPKCVLRMDDRIERVNERAESRSVRSD
jgi:hypothetical protein